MVELKEASGSSSGTETNSNTEHTSDKDFIDQDSDNGWSVECQLEEEEVEAAEERPEDTAESEGGDDEDSEILYIGDEETWAFYGRRCISPVHSFFFWQTFVPCGAEFTKEAEGVASPSS